MKIGVFTLVALLSMALPQTTTDADTYATIGAMVVLILLITLLICGEWLFGLKHKNDPADDEDEQQIFSQFELKDEHDPSETEITVPLED